MSPDVAEQHASGPAVRGAAVASEASSRPPRSRVLRLARCLAVVAGLIQLGVQAFVGIPVAWHNYETRRDVYQLFTHARMVRSGAPLYWSWSDYGPDVMTVARPKYTLQRMPYPPFLTPALSHLAGLPYIVFERIWSLLLLAGFWVYAACLARLATGRLDPPGVLGAGAILAIVPGAYGALGVGNVDPLLWAFIGLSLVSLRLRGVGFALVALIKLYGIWGLAVALLRERRKPLIGAAATTMAALAASLSALGVARFMVAAGDWSRYMVPVVGQGTFAASNLSLGMAGLRLVRLLGWDYAGGPLPTWARIYLLGIGIVAPAVTALATRRRSVPLQAAVTTCAAIAFGPICWTSYLPAFLAPIAVGLGESRSLGAAGAGLTRRATAVPA